MLDPKDKKKDIEDLQKHIAELREAQKKIPRHEDPCTYDVYEDLIQGTESFIKILSGDRTPPDYLTYYQKHKTRTLQQACFMCLALLRDRDYCGTYNMSSILWGTVFDQMQAYDRFVPTTQDPTTMTEQEYAAACAALNNLSYDIVEAYRNYKG